MDLIERAARKIADRKTSEPHSAPRPPESTQVPEAQGSNSQQASDNQDQLPKSPSLNWEEETSPHPPEDLTTEPRNSSRRSVRVDLDRLEKAGHLSPRHPVTRVAEEFRVLKQRVLTNIAKADADRAWQARVVMVTSSQPREGKTFTAINFALSIATERDKHVLLIDGDFAHPGVFKTLGLRRQPGFLDVLRDPNLDVGDVILRTNVEHLSLIDSGRSSAIATEFLSSDKMKRLVSEIANRYQDRVIVFDTAPLLATIEPSILSHHVGQILFVVEAGRTSQRAVKTALELIYDQDKVMMTLNKTKPLMGVQSFGSYYYYYKKSGQKSEETKKKTSRRLFSNT